MVLGLILILLLIVATVVGCLITDEVARQRRQDAMNDANWQAWEER